MAEFNAVNRGVYVADNLEFLQRLNDECIDLVCIDPPFSKGDTFVGDQLKPDLSEHEREVELQLLRSWGIRDENDARDAGVAWPATTAAGFKDVWSWEQDIHEDWIKDLAESHEAVSDLIETTRRIHDDHIAAYLCYMAVRLIEIHRVLKPTGSLFLHCDHTANGYLRQLLDSVFGKDQMQNEIVWCYAPTGNPPKRGFHRKHDTIFYYRKTNSGSFNHQYGPMSPKTLATYSKTDEDGRKYKIAQGGRRSYLDQQRGRPVPSWWDDIPSRGTAANAPEFTGYRTQKPIALAERIIKASTDEDDIVLDCFAGCASVAIAAERLGRNWVACDLNPRAWTVFKRQFSKPNLALLRYSEEISGQAVWGDEPVVTVHGPGQLPVRTSPIRENRPKEIMQPDRKFKVPSSIIPEEEMKKLLLEFSGYRAWCCGFANRMPDGIIIKTPRNFHLDYVLPRSEGGLHQITNRAPMCPSHNLRKSDKSTSLAEYRLEIASAGELCVGSINDLVDLADAYQYALDLYAQAYQGDRK